MEKKGLKVSKLCHFPLKQIDSLHEGWIRWKSLESLETGNIGDLTHFSCTLWPYRCLDMESEDMQENRMQANISMMDFVNPFALAISNQNSKPIVSIWVTGLSRVSVTHETITKPCPSQKGCAWKSRHAKNGLVRTFIPFNKLD